MAELSGDFSALIGGLALLSGSINKVRLVEENVPDVIAGDMLPGLMQPDQIIEIQSVWADSPFPQYDL